MGQTLFGIFHSAYERAPRYFFEAANSDYVNVFIVESVYDGEKFAVTMNELKNHPDKKAWIGVGYLGFDIVNETTVADTGERGGFNPKTRLYDDYRKRIDKMVAYLKEKGWYDSVVGFYLDEPLLWNVTNDMLLEFTRYFRTEAAPDKRFFVCFSVAGIAPEVWTINDVKPITERSVAYLTDIAFDMYHPWSGVYADLVKEMLDRAGDRPDLKVWMIACTMNYRGDKSEKHCLDHLHGCYDMLKTFPNPGGIMCFTYYTFAPEEEALGNIGLDRLSDPGYKDHWQTLVSEVKRIGKEICSGDFDAK